MLTDTKDDSAQGAELGPLPTSLAAAGPVTRSGLLLIADVDVDKNLLSALRQRDFEVKQVRDGARALLEIGRLIPDVVLLDARLPVLDGVTIVRTVRAAPDSLDIPILLAVGAEDRSKAAAGLDAGASACVSKPYRIHEVLTLIGSIDHRRRPPGVDEDQPEVLRSGSVTLDVERHRVWVDRTAVPMPPREFQLLKFLMERAGKVVLRETLLAALWGSHETDPNTLAVHVRRLRRRISAAAGGKAPIENVRGVGYRFGSDELTVT